MKTNYTADRMVFVGTGGIDHASLAQLAENHFFLAAGAARTNGAGTRAVPEHKLPRRRSALPRRYDALGQLCACSRGCGVELASLFPDESALVHVRQQGPLAWRVPTPLGAISVNSLANSYMSFSTSYSSTGLWGIYFGPENLV